MSNDFARQMRNGIKLPPESKDEKGRLIEYKPDANGRELVRVLSANGVSEKIMAKLLHVHIRTMKRYFKTEIEDGRDMITAKMGAALVKEGLAGNVAAQRYWLGTHGGPEWRIPKNTELLPDVFDNDGNETVHFYMPSNGRDQPEELEGPTIDGEAIEDAA